MAQVERVPRDTFEAAPPPRGRRVVAVALAAGLLAGLAGGFLLGRGTSPSAAKVADAQRVAREAAARLRAQTATLQRLEAANRALRSQNAGLTAAQTLADRCAHAVLSMRSLLAVSTQALQEYAGAAAALANGDVTGALSQANLGNADAARAAALRGPAEAAVRGCLPG